MVVEVEREKPLDTLVRFDNRGTKARGPLEYYTSATFNNLLHMHDAFTVNYAGAFQTRELQYLAGSYRQVLTAEGLTLFVNGSYSWGHPGRPIDCRSSITRPRARWFEGRPDLSVHPPARAQPDPPPRCGSRATTRACSSTSSAPPNSRNKLRGVRFKVNADLADRSTGHQPLNVVLSHGFEGLGAAKNGSDLLTPANGRVDFTKVEVTATRLQPLFGRLSRSWPPPMPNMPSPRCSPRSCAAMAGGPSGGPTTPRSCVGDSCSAPGGTAADLPIGTKEITQAQLYTFADRGRLITIMLPRTPAHL